MQRLLNLLRAEPAAFGALVGSVLPALVLLEIVEINEATIAAIVVAINAIVGIVVRLSVSPRAA
jgi:hypothetical protein